MIYHLGNIRFSFEDKNADGILSKTSNLLTNERIGEYTYYTFGMEQNGLWRNNVTYNNQRYRYNNKEWDEKIELLDLGARQLDPAIGRFWNVDNLSFKKPQISGFAFVANNPIVNIDPDGNDWYRDLSGQIRFNKDLHSVNINSVLKKGETYLGFEYKESTKNGTNQYRNDGSILFGSQADGVAYMVWATTKDGDTGGKQREQFGFIFGDKILVAPDEHNNVNTSSPEESGYKIGDGKFYDPVERNTRKFESTAHTHPIGSYPSGESIYEQGDTDWQIEKTPSKPGFVIGAQNGKVSMFFRNRIISPKDYSGKSTLTVKGLINGKQKFPKYTYKE